jgi:hypothetical protein
LNKSPECSLWLVSFLVGLRNYQHPLVVSVRLTADIQLQLKISTLANASKRLVSMQSVSDLLDTKHSTLLHAQEDACGFSSTPSPSQIHKIQQAPTVLVLVFVSLQVMYCCLLNNDGISALRVE